MPKSKLPSSGMGSLEGGLSVSLSVRRPGHSLVDVVQEPQIPTERSHLFVLFCHLHTGIDLAQKVSWQASSRSVQRFAFQDYEEKHVVSVCYRHLRCERCDYLQNLISYLPILVELNIAKIFSFVFGMGMFLSNHYSEYSFQPGDDLNIE